jgi:hypothetical protein
MGYDAAILQCKENNIQEKKKKEKMAENDAKNIKNLK